MAAERGLRRDLAQLPAGAGARGPRHGPPGATEDPRARVLLRVHAHGDRREPRRAARHGEGADAARPEEAPGPLRGPGDGGDAVVIAYRLSGLTPANFPILLRGRPFSPTGPTVADRCEALFTGLPRRLILGNSKRRSAGAPLNSLVAGPAYLFIVGGLH